MVELFLTMTIVAFGAVGPHCDPTTPLHPAPLALEPGTTHADIILAPGGFGFGAAVVHGELVVTHGGAGPPVAAPPPTDARIVAVAACIDTLYAVDARGRVFGAGCNGAGQATGGAPTTEPAPWTHIPLPVPVSVVSAGERHALALDAAGVVWGWGAATGDGTPATLLGPSPRVAAIAAGGRHSLAALTDGGVCAWGDNLRGQCGMEACTEVVRPTSVPALAGVAVVAVAAGAHHSVAVTAAGDVVEWGGAAGAAPRAVPLGVDVVSATCGAHHTMALDSDGGVWLWGAVGGGRGARRQPPRRLEVGGRAVAAAAGWWHGLVVVD